MLKCRGVVHTSLLSLAILAGTPAVLAGTAADVNIRDYKFTPDTLTIKAGTTVRWTNSEKRTSHSVQFPGAGFQSDRLFPDESWEHTFDKSGSYPYTCDPHAEMKGLIVVTD